MEKRERLIIEGGHTLTGRVTVSAAKNAVLPQMAAALLTDDCVQLLHAPRLADTEAMGRLLEGLGASVHRSGDVAVVAGGPQSACASEEACQKLRASFLVLGPLTARLKKAAVPLPGGCRIGARPVDIHLKGLSAMGAEVTVSRGCVLAETAGLRGTVFCMEFPSVGATENLMMAAALAKGTTVLENAAREPEVADLADMLNSMGAKVYGAGTGTVTVEGVQTLSGVQWQAIPDRVEAATLMAAAAITGGDVLLRSVRGEHLRPVIDKLRQMGAGVEVMPRSIRVTGGRLKSVYLRTMPYPGFPTDAQPAFAALACRAEGTSVITETVFENRFSYAGELLRMGARMRQEGQTLTVKESELTGAAVQAADLRAGAALALAALAARGVTSIEGLDFIDRGYEHLEKKLSRLGAQAERECSERVISFIG